MGIYIYIFKTCSLKRKPNLLETLGILVGRKFAEELNNIDWRNKINEHVGTESSSQNFYFEIEKIINYIALYQKLPQKEIKLE